MADNRYEGLGDEALSNARAIKDSVADIQDSTRRFNTALRTAGVTLADYGDLFRGIQGSANKVAENPAGNLNPAFSCAFTEKARTQANNKLLNLYMMIDF
jgi:hypothetical protein